MYLTNRRTTVSTGTLPDSGEINNVGCFASFMTMRRRPFGSFWKPAIRTRRSETAHDCNLPCCGYLWVCGPWSTILITCANYAHSAPVCMRGSNLRTSARLRCAFQIPAILSMVLCSSRLAGSLQDLSAPLASWVCWERLSSAVICRTATSQ
jgi:hypothetical protein